MVSLMGMKFQLGKFRVLEMDRSDGCITCHNTIHLKWFKW